MTVEERRAQAESYLGKTVHIEIDRPIGYVHHKKGYDLIYPINYGYIPGVLGGDAEELDVYLLGIDTPVTAYDAQIIGIVFRTDDVEDKLVGAPRGMRFTKEEILAAVDFQERYHTSYVEIF
ncbi:MAG: inorganic pyrophosphatase [Ruminococcaceae bacterium]|nr:inorganic pyrophosphatase [Oscillospiraceae bacterium]